MSDNLNSFGMTATRVWGSMSATVKLGDFESFKVDAGEEWTADAGANIPVAGEDAIKMRAAFNDCLEMRVRMLAEEKLKQLRPHVDAGQFALHFGMPTETPIEGGFGL